MTSKDELIFANAKEIFNKEKLLFGFEWNNRSEETIFVLIYLLFAAHKSGRYEWSEELINKILELRDFDDEDNETFLKNRFNLYNKVLTEGKVRADWKWGKKPENAFDAILYLYGDLMCDNSYYEDYDNCPVFGMDVSERIEFAEKLEKGLFPLIIEFASMLNN